MTDLEALLKAVVDNPGDDTPRLVLADKVHDGGDEELATYLRGAVAVCSCVWFDADTESHRYQPDCSFCSGRKFVPRCQHEGCRNGGRLCVLEGWERDPGPDDKDTEEYFCGAHAVLNGYCPACGSFWGGVNSFELNGICDHCADQFDADYEEEREWEDEQRDEWDDELTDQQ